MATEFRESGISVVGDTPWGTHLCFFYETSQDLLDILVPYFKAGLENHELCLWVIAAPLTEEDARSALHHAVPDLDRCLAERSLEILPYDAWYLTGGAFDLARVINGWKEKFEQALAQGYAGMRVSGDTGWIHKQDWRNFRAYEQELNTSIAPQRMIVLCTYPFAASGVADILDVARIHQVAVVRRNGQWEMVETPELKQAKEEIIRLNADLEQRVIARTSQLTATEEALREREIKYRSLFESSHDVILLVDTTGNILEINRRGAQLTGYSQSELHHMNVFQHLVPPEDHAIIRAVIADVLQGQAQEYEVRWKTKTGNMVYLDGASIPRFGASGEFLSSLCTLRDITERKRAEEALRESEERFSKAFRSSPATHMITRLADGRFLDVNDAFLHMFGYEHAEVIGHTALGLGLWANPQEQPALMQMLHEGRAVRGYETRARTKSGGILDLLVFMERIELTGEQCVLASAYDITERKRAEEMLHTFSQRLIETQEAERQRVARELHDEIGQALTVIKVNVQAVQSSTDAAPLALQLHESIGVIDRALQQVRDLAFDLRPSLLDDLGLVAALRWYVDREAQRAGFVAEFVADLSETRLPTELETACFRIAQAALTNVVRHAQARQVGVELRQHGTELHLVIRDNGVGFDVSAVGQRRLSEVHLGLQGMQERALILSGELEIISAPGRGTEIHAWFPLRSSAPPQSRESDTP